MRGSGAAENKSPGEVTALIPWEIIVGNVEGVLTYWQDGSGEEGEERREANEYLCTGRAVDKTHAAPVWRECGVTNGLVAAPPQQQAGRAPQAYS